MENMFGLASSLVGLSAVQLACAVSSQTYTWKNVKIGGGGGFVPDILFNPKEKGLAYARTDIGGAYKLNSDDSWTPLLDFAGDSTWNYWGVDAIATDPVTPSNLYLATGMYTNSWDPNNGQIMISKDYGSTWTTSKLPFKVGGNMPGRGVGERLVVDPNKNSILFFGARSGHGLWKSTDSGVTWTQVTSLPNKGTFVPDASDTSGYNSDPIGVAWVTFDSTSGSSGSATPRVFVGVVSNGTDNVFVSNDAGSTWSAIAGQQTTFLPHKGVLSPSEKSLYISYSDGAGPYDGTNGAVYKYNITAGSLTNITPVSGSDLYFGFGGIAVDLQRPGTVMVAALNSWWPDGQIFRSTDGGATWSPLWAWASSGYPNIDKFYKFDDTLAPWIGPDATTTELGTLQIGWMMEGLSIDPFDSNHWLYGTGETILGGHDLLNWDSTHNVTLKSLADGIEEESVQALVSPPTGPILLSAVGDDAGFVHTDLTKAPTQEFQNPNWATTADIDYAGNNPTDFVRVGTGTDGTSLQVAVSTDSGNTWNQDYGIATGVALSKVAYSANADTILVRTQAGDIQRSQFQSSFTTVSSLPSGSVIASDKLNNAIFYGASGANFYVSTDGGSTFTVKSTLGSSTAPVKIVVNPAQTGDVWVSTDKGLFHSTDTGASFTAISGISQAWGIGLGKAATTGGYPAIFAAANLGSVGYFRSDDEGLNWVQINDAAHGFGSAAANVVAGDPRIYGRVYIGTNGRGIFYGDASGSAPSPTATTSLAASSTTKVASSTTTKVATSTTSKAATTSVTSKATSSATTKASSTTTSSATAATQSAYGQCGGVGWSGATACTSGFKCSVQNAYYSQCIPS
ncbi:carbohydrate-binding module family 1 protein [Peniophora sp. CONT]|nr:carbohydrate-binding module family 1 protein [Peniophora sp. CONT]